MSSIRGKNTKPEMTIRRMLWASGNRYRIHDKTVFGTSDISIRKNKLVIFIGGCFWHGCERCYKQPKTNTEFWTNKIDRNPERRILVRRNLKKDGWHVLEFWEHEIKTYPHQVTKNIIEMLAQ